MMEPTKETHRYLGMWRPPFDKLREKWIADAGPQGPAPICNCGDSLFDYSEHSGATAYNRKKALDHWLAGHFDEPAYEPKPFTLKIDKEFNAEDYRGATQFPPGGILGSCEPVDHIRTATIEIGGTAVLGGPEIAESMTTDRVPFLDSQKNEIGYADNFRVDGDKTLCDLHIENKSFPGFVGRVRFASGSKEALEIEFPTIDAIGLVGEAPDAAFPLPPMSADDCKMAVALTTGRCPVCAHEFEMGQPPYFQVDEGGTAHDGERPVHWHRGTQSCPNCGSTWPYQDSD